MYVDDIVIFPKATRKNTSAITTTLINTACGQVKSSMLQSLEFFSQNSLTSTTVGRAVKHILQMKNLKKDVIYLGSPLFLSKAQSKDFKYLIDKVESKLMG